ncbi:MAG: PKD domain-containing protein, partial [Thermoplasmatota archaeon]
VTVIAAASDPEGEPLTWMFQFNDSIQTYRVAVFHTPASAPGEVVWNNITHVFGTEGTHRITLNISDALPPNQVWPHNVSQDISANVMANRVPMMTEISAFPSNPVMMDVSLGYVLVEFTVGTYDMDGDVLTVVWDFGDGSPSATNLSDGGPSVYYFVQNHNYTSTGNYNVTVTVSDGRTGHDVTKFLVLHVTSNDLPPTIMSWTSIPGSNAYVGEPITFTLVIADPEQDPIELVWNFTDGSSLVYVNLTEFVDGNTTSVVEHSFASAGAHEVKVQFTDNKDGLFNHIITSTYSIDVIPDDVSPVANAGMNLTVPPGTLVQFNGSGSHDNVNIVTYTWTFIYDGAPVTLTDPEPVFTFLIYGVYDVTLNVTDAAGNFDTATVRITVEPAIPEFPNALVPIVGILVLFIGAAIRRGSRED